MSYARSVLALAGRCKSGRVGCDEMSGDSRGKSTLMNASFKGGHH